MKYSLKPKDKNMLGMKEENSFSFKIGAQRQDIRLN